MTGLPNHLTLIAYTQHWYLDPASRCWYRDAWVRDTAGALLFVGIRDDLAGGEL